MISVILFITFLCLVGSQNPADCSIPTASCAVYDGATGMIGAATPIICYGFLPDWYKTGDSVWANTETEVIDLSPLTGNNLDVYELPQDEAIILQLSFVLADPQVGGSEACYQESGELLCALAWTKCLSSANCFDYINKTWCQSKVKSCGLDQDLVTQYYGDYWTNLLSAISCDNTEIYTAAKRDARQDWTPNNSDAQPRARTDLNETTKGGTKINPKNPKSAASSIQMSFTTICFAFSFVLFLLF